MGKKISIYTRVYNTEKYLNKCLESVVNQTFKDFQHVIIDNGCTDGCTEILKRYAEKYSWVKLIRFDENRSGIDIGEYIDTPYFCQLDSDDWLEETFLEKMINLIEREQADIVATGSYFHFEATNQLGVRNISEPLWLTSDQFAEYYPKYHQIFRTTWGKLYKTSFYYNASIKTSKAKLSYGSDTVLTFNALREAQRVCIDNSVLYHYRVHNASTSYHYEANRFDSDVYLYEDAKDFLSAYGPISEYNNFFISAVYANALKDTVNCIVNSSLTQKEKLEEYYRIVTHPVTVNVFVQKNISKSVSSVYDFLTKTILDVQVTPENENLFQEIMNSLKQGMTLNDIVNLLVASDEEFYNAYYKHISNMSTLSALNQMTELLGNDQVKTAKNTFYRVYIYLAAYNEQIPEFLLGKIQYAKYLLEQQNKVSCQYLLDELADMQVDSDEIRQLRESLERL